MSSESTHPQPPPPAKRHPRRIGFFDLPRAVRERIYAHYFTYPRGLYLHLVYLGHFPRPPRHTFAGGHVTGGIHSLTLQPSREDEDGSDSDEAGEEDEWPFPNEAPSPSTSFLFSTVQDTPLRPASDTAMETPPLSPNDPFHSPTSPPPRLHAPSTRQRLMSLPTPRSFHAHAALRLTCYAIYTESHSFPWRINTVHVITAPPSQAPFLDDQRPKDGMYHLHLGVLPPRILGAIRTLGLSGDVVRELPPRSGGRRVDDMVVQRRVWGVVEREMAGLRRLIVGGGDGREGLSGCEARAFLRWVLSQGGVGRGKCRVFVEGGFIEGDRDDGEGIGEYFVAGKKQDDHCSSSESENAMAAHMGLPKGLWEVRIRMSLPERLRRDFEALSWGDMRAVPVGKKTEMIVQEGRQVQWRAVVYEMRQRQESGEKGKEGLAEKVHAIYTGTMTRDEEGDEKRKSLSDKVYDKLRRMS